MDVFGKGSRNLLDSLGLRRRGRCGCSGRLRLRSEALCRAADKLTILDRALDEPVAFTETRDTLVDASLAEIVVTTVAGTAVIVDIGHNLFTSIAEDSPWSFGDLDWGGDTERQDMLGTLSD